MALNATATAARGYALAAARHRDARGIAAGAATCGAQSIRQAAARELWTMVSTRRSPTMELLHPALRRAADCRKTQQHEPQQQQRIQSSCCGPSFLLPPDCEAHAAALRQDTPAGQRPGVAEQTASAVLGALAADSHSRPTAEEGRPAKHEAGARSGGTAARGGSTRATASLVRNPAAAAEVIALPGEEAAKAAASAPVKGCGVVSIVAARLGLALTTAAIPYSIRGGSASGQHFYRFSCSTEVQRACKIAASEVAQGEGKKFVLPLLSQLRCTYSASMAAVPAVATRRSSSSSSSSRFDTLAATFPQSMQHCRLSLPTNTATALPRRTTAASRGGAAAPLPVTESHKHPSGDSTAAAAALRAAPVVGGCGRAAAASWGAGVCVPVFCSFESAVVLGIPEAGVSLPAAVGRHAGSSLVPRAWRCAAVGRSMVSVSASAAAIAAASAVPAAASSGSGAAAAGGGSSKAEAILPLGTLYSKTHEYVHLLLEFVGPTDDNPGAAAQAALTGSKGGGAVAESHHTPRPRRCQLVGIVGISAHAAEELGEVVYCEYTRPLAAAAAAAAEVGKADAPAEQRHLQQHRAPGGRAGAAASEGAVGEKAGGGGEQEKMWVRRGSPICSLESVKSVAEVYSPVEGVVLAINAAVAEEPALVWRHSEGDGWLVKLLLPLPAGRASGSSSDDEISSAYAVHLTDADVAANAAEGGPAAARGEAAGSTSAFMQACRDCPRVEEALLGLRRRLMGPEQYMQFVEREKKATSTEI